MSPAESADVVIEMDAVNGELGPDFAALACPTVFVVGTGAHSGATEEEMRTVRAAAADAAASNESVSVFATTPHKHTDPQQGARHRGRRDRGRHPSVSLTGARHKHVVAARTAGGGGREESVLVLPLQCADAQADCTRDRLTGQGNDDAQDPLDH